jgi:predicted nucleic acid-binding protein
MGGLLGSIGGFFKHVGSDVVHDGQHLRNTAVNGAKAGAHAVATAVRSSDAANAKAMSWLDSGEQFVEGKIDQGRSWLRQHGGVAGQVASDYIGFTEGADKALFDTAKGVVQLANNVQALGNPLEWAANPGANIARVKAGVQAVEGLGKLANLTQPASWIMDPQGNERMVSALWQSAKTNFEADPSKATGYVAGTIATFFIPGGGEAAAAGDAAKVAEVGADAAKAADVADAANVAADVGDAGKLADAGGAADATPIDPQLDNNFLINLKKGQPDFVAYATANKPAGLSYNFSARGEFLANGLGTRADLRLLEQQWAINLIRDVPPSVIDNVAQQLRTAFTDGRVLAIKDSRIAATAFIKGERLATNDLQFFKRALDLGINVEYVGSGNAAAKAANYVANLVNVSWITW